MKLICYQLQRDAFISEIPCTGILAVQPEIENEPQFWLEVEETTTAELEENLKQLNLHPLIMEDCINPDHGTLIDRYPEAVYIEFPTNAGHDYGEVAYLSIICLPASIITIRRRDVAQLPQLIASLQQDSCLELGNTANLLYKLIDYFIDKTVTQSLVYRQQLNLIAKSVVHDPDDLDPNQIADLKRQVSQLESICEDQLYCAKSLVTHTDTVIQTTGQEAYFHDLVSDAEQGLRAITRLNNHVKDLQDNYVMQQHDSFEKRLGILTIISAIFLPLTFFTGFFGMNFINMGMLEWEYGSILVTVLMVFISLSLLWYFNSRGWFD